MEAGIHRLRATIHLVSIIDDTLNYLRPRCLSSVPYLRVLLSSQLFTFLLSIQHPKTKQNKNKPQEKVEKGSPTEVLLPMMCR